MKKTAKEHEKELGEKAMALIGDYPLYAKTSGITYFEAIKIALVIYPDCEQWDDLIKEM